MPVAENGSHVVVSQTARFGQNAVQPAVPVKQDDTALAGACRDFAVRENVESVDEVRREVGVGRGGERFHSVSGQTEEAARRGNEATARIQGSACRDTKFLKYIAAGDRRERIAIHSQQPFFARLDVECVVNGDGPAKV